MAFGNVRGMGTWGVALAASLALHVVVIGIMAVLGMGGGEGGKTPPPPVPQTDGRAQDLPPQTDVEQSATSSVVNSDTSSANAKVDRPQQGTKGKQQEIGRSTKSDRSKPDPRKASTSKEDKGGSSAEPAKEGWKSYKVKPGDSLTKIARACGCTVPELAKANGLSTTASLKLGQIIKVRDLPSDAE